MKKLYTHAALKEKISSINLKQTDIARAVGCSQSQISRIINGDISQESRLFKKVVHFAFQNEEQRSKEGEKILSELLDDCWDGTLEQALIFNDIIRSATKLYYL